VTFSDANGEFTPVRDYDNSHPNTLYLAQEFATDYGPVAGSGAIRLSKIEGTVGAETFAGGNVGTVNIADAWSDTGPDGADFAPQMGTSTKIDTGDSRLDNCLMRHGTIWCAHTVFLPYGQPTRAAAQWFQIDPSGAAPALVQRGRIDDRGYRNALRQQSLGRLQRDSGGPGERPGLLDHSGVRRDAAVESHRRLRYMVGAGDRALERAELRLHAGPG